MSEFKEFKEGLEGLKQALKDYKAIEKDPAKLAVYKKAIEGIEKVPKEMIADGWSGTISVGQILFQFYLDCKKILAG